MSETPNTPGKPKRLLLIILVLLVILVGAYVVRLNTHRPNTNDAYVFADSVRVIPEVKGAIVSLPIIDNQRVRADETLFVIDPTPYKLELARAQGALNALDNEIVLAKRAIEAQQFGADAAKQGVTRAVAALKQAEDTYHRMQPMLSKGYVSAEALDLARTTMVSAQAQLVAARFEAQRAQAAVTGVEALVAKRKIVETDIALAQFNLDHTIIQAPFDGIVTGLKVQAGQVVGTLVPTMTLINTSKWYVVANFRETDLANIQPGDPARLYLLGNTSRAYQGKVESVGFGVMADNGGDLLPTLPYVARTINWVRVEQRFPVRILVDQPDPNQFRIGASATATINP
jgi:multidrug efflux system membrane fusion protein